MDPAASRRIVGKPEVVAQIGPSGDYFRLARDSGTILRGIDDRSAKEPFTYVGDFRFLDSVA